MVERTDSGLRALHFSTAATQTLINPQHPQQLQLEYTAVMSLALLMVEQPKRVLLIGLGGGALLQHIFHYFPQLEIHVIERRQAVIDVAQKYFFLPSDQRIKFFTADAQQQLKQLAGHYDVIFNDAYSQSGPDISLYSEQVYQQFQRLLSRQGVVINNLWQRRIHDNHQLLGCLRQYFSEMAYHQDNDGRSLVLFTGNQPWQKSVWQQRCQEMATHCQQPLATLQRSVRYSLRRLKMWLWIKGLLSSLGRR